MHNAHDESRKLNRYDLTSRHDNSYDETKKGDWVADWVAHRRASLHIVAGSDGGRDGREWFESGKWPCPPSDVFLIATRLPDSRFAQGFTKSKQRATGA
jgi:hypothetical protein